MLRQFFLFFIMVAVFVQDAAAFVLLSDFESDDSRLSVDLSLTNSSLFVTTPRIMPNPVSQPANTSAHCLGASNVANADWWQNFINLKLKSGIKVTDDNRFLVFKAYRSIQPKMMRVGFNSYETDGWLFQGDLARAGTWQEVVVDMGANYMNQVLTNINIVLSCNWSLPRSGWGTADYYFDDFMLMSAAELATRRTVIDLNATHQTIVDFGASDCWLGDLVGRYFSDAMRERAAKFLFSKAFNRGGNPEGIGLSNWRVNLGAGSTDQGDGSNIEENRRADSFLTRDGKAYDWSKAAGQQYFMQKAKEYGVEHFLFFSNSAPYQFTSNGKACNSGGGWGTTLRSDCYDDFAEYLATVTKHFVDLGYPVRYVSPVNEPQYDWTSGQEGSPWLNEEIARLVREIDNSFTERGLETKIIIPEAGAWYFLSEWTAVWGARSCEQIEAFFNPSRNATYVGNLSHLEQAIAGHDYWTFADNPNLVEHRRQVRDVAAQYGLKVFQTEWSMLDDAPQATTGFPEGSYEEATYMDIALYMAKLIYTDMVYADMASWSYWTAFAQEQWGQKNRFYLLRVNAAGDTGTESYGDVRGGGTIVDNRNLWVLGNYCRFVRPGYKRVDLTGACDLNGLMGSAYVSPAADTAVVVYVNMAHDAQQVSVEVNGLGKRLVGLKKYTTSSAVALNYDRNLPYEYAGGAIEVPARSVVTLVIDLADESGSLDVTGDGAIDIADVNAIINVMLGATVNARADVTGDGQVDIADINAVISAMLH